MEKFWNALDPRLRIVYCRMFGSETYKETAAKCFISQPDPASSQTLNWLYFQSQLAFIQCMMIASMISNRTKAAHPPFSVVASGTFIFDTKAAQRFGATQKSAPIVIRHTYSQMNKTHPLAKSVKSLAISIKDFFDCTFLSGNACPFFNIPTFQAFIQLQKGMVTGTDVVSLVKKYPCLLNAALSVPGPNSHSYLDLAYCSMMPYDEHKSKKLIKFSVFPQLRVKARFKEQQQLAWIKSFTRDLYYTKADAEKPREIYEIDYKKQFDQYHGLKYQMVYQERENTDINRNAAFPWTNTPYVPFGDFVITELQPDTGTTVFDICQMPKTLYLPDATDGMDPKVIGHIRKTLYPTLQDIRQRLLSLHLF